MFFVAAISYNQPTFDRCASWNPNGTTFANATVVGQNPYGLFVSSDNNVYVPGFRNGATYIWLQGGTLITTTISATRNITFSVFVSELGDIYLDNGAQGQVEKWPYNSGGSCELAMRISYSCLGLFVDLNNTLYCSATYAHKVLKRWLNSNTSSPSIAAGTGCAGENSTQLIYPRGIFVDLNFSLYVADSGNNRIQCFAFGQLTATTVAGNGASGTFLLNRPTSVVLDADGYLFIVDSRNHRIVAEDAGGFRCVVGCSGRGGNRANQLSNPMMISFGTQGDIFVSDWSNNRIQKFLLTTNSCRKSHTQKTCSVKLRDDAPRLTLLREISRSSLFSGKLDPGSTEHECSGSPVHHERYLFQTNNGSNVESTTR